MAKKPTRTWAMVASLGIPLAIVGVSAMAISYATLIDVARVNGLPLPELFPVLVDVGTVATMIAAAQFRMRGVSGRWLAYTTFILLSGVSIVANATHAWRAADMTVTSPWAAAILASTPPAALLAITHLVMMLIPDEKERAKLQALRDRAEFAPRRQAPAPEPPNKVSTPSAAAYSAEPVREEPTAPAPLRLVNPDLIEAGDDEVRELVLDYVVREGKRPTGKVVGDWLGGKTPKTGQRFLKRMEDEGLLEQGDTSEPAGVSAVANV
ncbi:hypothetical protein NHL51_01115 [Leucobacter sp. gxy201]|uniref:hypothetical protein n=1 Tax=Leucobacter sp. gxy201 TaxID=2957200 RepID=UPI003DA08EBE